MEEHLNFLYECDKELITEELEWDFSRNFYRIEADVLAQNGEQIKFKGTYSPRSRDFSFILLYKRKHIVRQFDMEPRHWNPDGTVAIGEHKHRWSDTYNDTYAYTVDDIDTSNINKAIFDFFEECNISYSKVSYKPILMI
jgi:hypothetical protein